MKKLKALILLIVFLLAFIGGFTTVTAPQAQAIKCCWVMVCTNHPPIICWEECRPCPKLP